MAVVGFAAAVFVLPVAVAQDAQLAVPQALELGPVQDVPQAALLVAQDALPVRNAALVARSDASPGDPQDDQPDDCSVVHSGASPGDPQDDQPVDCLAAHCSVALPGDPQGGPPVDCLAARCSVALPGDPQVDQPVDCSVALPGDPQDDPQDDQPVDCSAVRCSAA